MLHHRSKSKSSNARRLRKLAALGALVAGFAVIAMQPAHALVYFVDDGTGAVNLAVNPGGAFTFGNQFNILPGGETITSVSIRWGIVAAGTPMTAKLWSDPNADGNPSDAVVLSSIPGLTISGSGDIFASYDIPDITLLVGQSFFVGATIIHLAGEAPSVVDAASSQPLFSNKSWVAGSADFAGSSPINVGTVVGGNSDLMVRANGVTAVPEPGSLALLGIGVAAFGLTRRRKKA
jgi:hypothetical protein